MSQLAPAIYSGFHLTKKKPIGLFHSLDLHEKMYFKVTFDFIVLTSYN